MHGGNVVWWPLANLMNKPPLIELYVWSDDARLQPLYTGLHLLHRSGAIRLRQKIVRDPESLGFSGLRTGSSHLLLTLPEKGRLFFDTTDAGTMNPSHVEACDGYFKRSYESAVVAMTGEASRKIHPLGLNYPVYPDEWDALGLRRALAFGTWRDRVGQVARVLDTHNLWSHLPRQRQLQAVPAMNLPSRILFLVRAWDPQGFAGCTAERIAHYTEVNEMRAACVRALRQAFGPMFTGGFSHTAFAKKHFPDLLAPDPALTSKRQYLRLLAEHPICVTSGGLHRSLGWKLGEYVALSKAIVTERLAFEVPGGFAEGKNYLSYADAEGCVAAVNRLVHDQALRGSMMQSNRDYFLNHLRPDRLMANALGLELPHLSENHPLHQTK